MYQAGRVSDRVHRSHKEHNRWMYVAPQRNTFSLRGFLDGVLIALAYGAIIISVAMVLVIPLIG